MSELVGTKVDIETGLQLKVRTGAVCPVDPLYCSNSDPHRCYNEDTGEHALVIGKNDERATGI